MDRNSKVMTAGEAVAQYVHDGDCLAIGGFVTNRRPYALVREIIRQKKRNLYLEGGPSGGDMDMLIGAGCVEVMMVSYVANSGYTMVCRRFRDAIEKGTLLYDDYSLDVQTIAYHGAALGLPYVPVKNMLGSDLADKWGIPADIREKYPKLPKQKFVVQEDPFHAGSQVCCVPTPDFDVAMIHAQVAAPDGTCIIDGPEFQDVDIAVAARHTIVSCERLASNEELHAHPERNTIAGLCVDAVVPVKYGAHPSQCFGCYDYDSDFYQMYDKVSRTQEDFDRFIQKYIDECPTHGDYLDKIGAARLVGIDISDGYGYHPGLKRK